MPEIEMFSGKKNYNKNRNNKNNRKYQKSQDINDDIS